MSTVCMRAHARKELEDQANFTNSPHPFCDSVGSFVVRGRAVSSTVLRIGTSGRALAPPITAPLVLARGFKHKCDVISITITFASQVSSDLSSGRRPTSKSDEFCDANVIVY
jgi:hypothetical protein